MRPPPFSTTPRSPKLQPSTSAKRGLARCGAFWRGRAGTFFLSSNRRVSWWPYASHPERIQLQTQQLNNINRVLFPRMYIDSLFFIPLALQQSVHAKDDGSMQSEQGRVATGIGRRLLLGSRRPATSAASERNDSMNVHLGDHLLGVRATIAYLHRGDRKPYPFTFEPPPGVPARSGQVNEVKDVLVRDARPLAPYLSVEEQGFQLLGHFTRVADLYDDEERRRIYDLEISELLKSTLGAEKVVVFDHTIRSVPRARQGIKGMREPVRRAHNDYTELSGPRRVSDHLDPLEAKARLKRRFMEINVWRPIVGPLEDTPLAVCDARTVAHDDLIASDLIYPDKVGETYALAHNEEHRWFYFPKMGKDEVILIKGYDSDKTNAGRFTPHTGFDDPTTPPDALPRESLEGRTLVFF